MGKTRRFNKENYLYEDEENFYHFRRKPKNKSKTKVDIVQEKRKQKIKSFQNFDKDC